MRNKKNILILIMSVLLVSVTFSCKEEWDEHYLTTYDSTSELNIFEYIRKMPEMSKFSDMLVATGYDKVLSGDQTYTVWVPSNEALNNLDISDIEAVKLLVSNHIAHFSVPSVEARNKTIIMLNDKRVVFKRTGEDYFIDGYKLKVKDISVKNGIIHQIQGFMPYKYNHWEYIAKAAGIDSLRSFIRLLDYKSLDTLASFKDGVFKDSVFKYSNYAKTLLGAFDDEDSIYTMIVPDNNAWNDLYSKVYPLYKALPSSGGAPAQIRNTKWAMVRDLVFRGRLVSPFAELLYSTNGNKFANPSLLFQGSESFELSNGLIYKTSKINHTPSESWNKEIRIEAEDPQDGKRITMNYALSTISGVGTGMEISGNRYISALPKTSSSISKLSIKFPIPNVLATKYRIYAVFVPTYAMDKNDKRPYKLNFYMSYTDKNGVVVNDSKLTVAKNTTDTTSVTKLLVADNFEFQYSNLVSEEGMLCGKNVTTYLKIENGAGTSAAELKNFNRTIKVDCVILEPVQ